MFPKKWCKGLGIQNIRFFSNFEVMCGGCGSALLCSTALQPLHSAVALWQSITLYSTLHSTRSRASTHSQYPPALLSDAARIGSTAFQNHKRLLHHVRSSDRALYSVEGSGFFISVSHHVSPILTKNIQRLSQKSMFSSDPRSIKEVINVCSTYIFHYT